MAEIIKKMFSMCCGGKKCPVVTIEGEDWTIKDDFGGKVKLTKDQVKEFIEHSQKEIDG
jgi:hypothetical protein